MLEQVPFDKTHTQQPQGEPQPFPPPALTPVVLGDTYVDTVSASSTAQLMEKKI